MEIVSSAIVFLIVNAFFHASASDRFSLIRLAREGGLNPPPTLPPQEQLLTILSYLISPIAGVIAVVVGTEGYNFVVWLPAVICWYVGFQVFRRVSNPKLKALMCSWGVVIVPFLLWVMIIRVS